MIHVVYTIYKKDSAKVHDVVTVSDQYWLENKQVTGGIRDLLAKQYPEDEFYIQVSTVTSTGNQTNE